MISLFRLAMELMNAVGPKRIVLRRVSVQRYKPRSADEIPKAVFNH
jgi:hypothetical protein